MPLEPTKTFPTPIQWVTFTYGGNDQTVEAIVERTILDDGTILVKTETGAFYAVKHWDTFEQSPNLSFF